MGKKEIDIFDVNLKSKASESFPLGDVDNYLNNSVALSLREAFIKGAKNYIPARGKSLIRFISVDVMLPDINPNVQLLVKVAGIGLNGGDGVEIARFTEYGFHYGTGNTQDKIYNVIAWALINEF